MARLLGRRRRILDLGCGDGTLLQAAALESPDAIRLVGVDVDQERLPEYPPLGFEYRVADALELPNKPKFDGIISNPPYVTVRRLDPIYRERLRREFTTLSGQFDLAFAFVEKAISLLEVGGRGVFLLPEGMKTRPAAARLRRLLDQCCRWNTVQVRTHPFAAGVSVEAEILWFDRTEMSSQAAEETGLGLGSCSRISVGIATGANTAFIRSLDDPWLEEVEPCFVRQFVRGRDIAASEDEHVTPSPAERLIVPYLAESHSLWPADESEFPGLRSFLEAHQGELGQGRRRGSGYFIQCPRAAVLGTRVVVPEVFREPAVRVVPDGVAVLNSAFIIVPGPGRTARELASDWSADAARPAMIELSRRLGSGYRRITARGLAVVLSRLDPAELLSGGATAAVRHSE